MSDVKIDIDINTKEAKLQQEQLKTSTIELKNTLLEEELVQKKLMAAQIEASKAAQKTAPKKK